MFVRGVIADVVGVNLDQVIGNGTLEDADIKIRLKDFRKQAEDIKSHGQILDDSAHLGKRNTLFKCLTLCPVVQILLCRVEACLNQNNVGPVGVRPASIKTMWDA